KEATPASDLYALGLILFEMLTGRCFYEAKTLGELKSLHRESKTARFQSAANLLEPELAHVILQCLEEEASARPSSALRAMAPLHGGDRLEAAVAAGEPPSPDVVAAAERVGDLSPLAAWSCLLASLGGLVLIAWLFDRTGLLHREVLPRSPESLSERAHELLARISPGPAADVSCSFEVDAAFLVHGQLVRPSSPH